MNSFASSSESRGRALFVSRLACDAMLPTKPKDDGAAAAGKLRELADWYRRFAERAGNPAIWDARLRTAEDLDAEASRIEQRGIAGCGRLSNISR